MEKSVLRLKTLLIFQSRSVQRNLHVKDAAGNQSTIVRTVTVNDTTKPQIFLSGGTGKVLSIDIQNAGYGYTEAEALLKEMVLVPLPLLV